MGLSDLDGFLTGVVVGPELIPPSEWLPVIWGGQEPEFATEAEMRTVLGAILGRYNEIAACFNTDPDEFDPVFWEGPEGEVIASADSAANENKLLAEASDMIPACIAGIHEFWRNYQTPSVGRGRSRPGGHKRR